MALPWGPACLNMAFKKFTYTSPLIFPLTTYHLLNLRAYSPDIMFQSTFFDISHPKVFYDLNLYFYKFHLGNFSWLTLQILFLCVQTYVNKLFCLFHFFSPKAFIQG